MSNIIQPTLINDSMYRPSGGSDNITSGIAKIQSIKGNTIAWNHLIESRDCTSGVTRNGITIQGNGVYKISGTSTGNTTFMMTTREVTFIGGHKYYFGGLRGGSETSYRLWVSSASAFPAESRLFVGEKPTIKTALDTETVSPSAIFFQATRQGLTIDTTISPTLFDLTLIYGAGDEPTTPEQFEADYEKWFGKPLTYEEYDEGSLRSVQMNAIKTTGFNRWDEKWELGTYNQSTGEKENSNLNVRCKNPLRVFPNQTYFCNTSSSSIVYLGYGIDGSYLGTYSVASNSTIVIPSGCYYIKFYLYQNYGTTYKNDICINISNSSKNGTYEPYEEHIAPIPVTTLKGKLNGAGESVTIFPDGMRSAGSVHDELYVSNGKTYAVKRVGAVDLGSSVWSKKTDNGVDFFVSTISDAHYNNSNICENAILGFKYDKVANLTTLESVDKTWLMFYAFAKGINIRDDSYSDANTFRIAMNGVPLYYELAEPLVYEVEDFTLPIYQVDEDGTEEQVQVPNTQGVAAIIGSKYCGIIKQYYDNNSQLWYDFGTGLTYNETTQLWYYNGEPIYQNQIKQLEASNSGKVTYNFNSETMAINTINGLITYKISYGLESTTMSLSYDINSLNKVKVFIDNRSNNKNLKIELLNSSGFYTVDGNTSVIIPSGRIGVINIYQAPGIGILCETNYDRYILPEGDIQIFTDITCTRYATGQIQPGKSIFARMNTRVDKNGGWSASETAGNINVTTPTDEYPNDPFCITYDVDFISEDIYASNIPAGTIIELNNASLEAIDVTDYPKIFTKPTNNNNNINSNSNAE